MRSNVTYSTFSGCVTFPLCVALVSIVSHRYSLRSLKCLWHIFLHHCQCLCRVKCDSVFDSVELANFKNKADLLVSTNIVYNILSKVLGEGFQTVTVILCVSLCIIIIIIIIVLIMIIIIIILQIITIQLIIINYKVFRFFYF